MVKVDTLNVQITGAVTGRPHYLAYSVGQIVELPTEKANELIEADKAVVYNSQQTVKPKAGKVERAVSRKVKKSERR